ncbi:MAG: MG2 domain-containing protein [Pyrinomonadaceae bacterium]
MSRRWIILLCCLILPLVVLPHSSATGGIRVNETTTRMLLREGQVQLSMENSVGREIAARVELELLDVDNGVRASTVRDETIQTGASLLLLPLQLPPPTPGMTGPGRVLWYRLRLRVTPSSPADNAVNKVEEIIAMSEITPDIFMLQLAAPNFTREGTRCRLHVRATHPVTSRPVNGVSITGEIDFDDERKAMSLKATATTDDKGYITLDFDMPRDIKDENGNIKVVGRLGNLVQEASDSIKLDRSARILLNTDKPLYQPGQVVNMRALVFDPSRHAMPGADAAVKITDEEGTTVFRASLKTSRFGIASADWTIPESTRLGDYTVRVEMEEGDDDDMASQMIKISRYDLPNFAVNAKPDREYYLPGQSAEVEVRGDYLFGEPVTRGHARVVRETERKWDYSAQKWVTEEGQKVEGELDHEGRFVAHLDLEADQNELAQSSYERYRDLTFAAYLTDPTTNRTEQRRFALRLTREAIHVYLSEANSTQAEGLPLEFYLSTFYADGTPARCEVAVSEEVTTDESAGSATTHHALAGSADVKKREQLVRRVATNRYGVARVKGPVIDHREGGSREMKFILTARDSKGKTGHYDQQLEINNGPALRVETDKALYRVGDPIKARIIANKPDMAVILDVARDLQVIRSEVVRLNNGEAVVTLPYNADFKDRLTIAAYSNDVPQQSYYYYNYVAGRRTVLYPRDRELKLDVQLGRDTYRPGEEASADLQMYTPDGRSVEGALGVVVLDRAVEERARTNQEFGSYGFYNNFHAFLYGYDSLASLTHRDLERIDMHHGLPEGVDLAAEVLLQRAQNNYALNFAGGREYIPNMRQVFSATITAQIAPVNDVLTKHYTNTTEYPADEQSLRRILNPFGINFDALRDPWGEPFRPVFSVERASDVLDIICAGPDKRLDTEDDFLTARINWPYFLRTGEKINRIVADYHTRTGGYIRDAATFKSELRRAGLEFDSLRDRWGKPYSLAFSTSGTIHAIDVRSGGPNRSFETTPNYGSDDFSVWTARNNYFTETMFRIDAAFVAYAKATARFPLNEAELRDALRGSGIELNGLRDAWGGRYYVDYKTEVRPDYHALNALNEVGRPRTSLIPNTRQVSTVRFFSYGPDGRVGTHDDFTAAAFTSDSYRQMERNQTQRYAPAPVALPGNMGMVNGRVLDPAGAAIPGASIIITNKSGESRETISNEEGFFEVSNLEAGLYTMRVEMAGFKTTLIQEVAVRIGQTNIMTVNLELGQIAEVVEVTDVAQIDQSSSAVGQNLNEQLYGNVPVQRTVSSLFYLSPGGRNNPALAGGAALDNAYIADGVNTNDSAIGEKGATTSQQEQSPISTPRLREYFPETLVWQPALETDTSGRARLNFKLADNITTWKMSVIGSTLDGEIGTAETEFRAFQPFFVEHDPPRVLTEGDEIDLPVVLRNYMEQAQSVDLSIKPESWFALLGPAQKRSQIAARDSTRETFPLRAVASVDDGRQRITATGTEASDAIEKPVRVHPDGQEAAITDSQVFIERAVLEANIPGDAIDNALRAEVKIYPHLMGHVIESIEGIMQRPYGCGEQTISSTYPSLMVLRAYKHTGGTPPAKARRFTQAGYDRLLNYRAASGGFNYWGAGDADLALTAYALRFLNDAREFVAVDEDVIKKARAWLIEQQGKDGSWSGGNWHGMADGRSRALNTAFIASVLAATNDASASTKTTPTPQPSASPDPLARAFDFLSRTMGETKEPYLIASYALAAMSAGRSAEGARAVARLRVLARTEGAMNYWAGEANTPFHGWGLTGQIETTALAVQALSRSRRELAGQAETMQDAKDDDQLIGRGLLFLIRTKDRYGVWYSTQATINVLNALIGVPGTGVKGDAGGGMAEIIVNGRQAASVRMPQVDQLGGPLHVDISKFISTGNNRVEIRRADGSAPTQATAQLVSTYWIPWPASRTVNVTNLGHAGSAALRLSVAFDKREVKMGDDVTCQVSAGRTEFYGYGMLLAEIGLPPGADVDRASLDRAMKDTGGRLNRYDILPDRLIVYIWPSEKGMVNFEFKFRPRYGLAALSAPSLLYDYYNPEARTTVPPTKFTVR